MPDAAPASLPGVFSTFDEQLIEPRALSHAQSYHLQSYPEHRALAPLSASERHLDLQLPPGRNPRSLELARSLRAAVADDAAFVDSVLQYLRAGGFSYTLTPARLDLDSVDDLLFRTREGFCGHYASAFVSMMRAGGVPARVVTGYLGGTWNRYGNYLLVQQADAHAWAEVWLDAHGWVRVDPTAVVAPGRLTRGLDDLLPGAAGGANRLLAVPWVGNLVQAWQALNALWQDEFIGFNFSKQLALLDRLGLRNDALQSLALLLAAGAGLWLGLLAWGLRPRSARSPEDRLSRAWRSLERKLRSAAPARAIHEGPIAYAERVARAAPESAGMVMALARAYAQLRYGPAKGAAELERFCRAVRRCAAARQARTVSGAPSGSRGERRARPRAREQQRAADEEQFQHQNREPLIAADRGDQPHRQRPEHRSELGEHVVEPKIFPGALARNQLREIGPRQRLHPALHCPDHRGEHIELPFGAA